MRNSITFLTLLLIVALSGFSQQDHAQNGWESFKNNDLTTAREHFLKATTENPNDADSWLMLSIIANSYQNEVDALSYFIRFSNLKEDINPYFVSYFVPDIIGFSAKKKTPEMYAFLQNLLSSGKLDLKNEAILLEVLAGHYFHTRDFRNYKDCLQKIGSVNEWQIAGTFENVSESGFDKTFAPISNPYDTSLFKDKTGNEIKWFKRIESYKGKWMYLEQNFDIAGSIIYSQTFCNSPSDQEVVMRVGTSGSLKVWVNDKLLFSESEERNNGLDTYIFTAKLNEGNNRILLQTGSATITRNNFMLRISDRDEKLVTNLSFSASYKDYTKDTGDFVSETIMLADESYFKERIACEPENLLNYILLAKSYLSMDKTFHALELLEQAQQIAPECSFLLILELEAYYRNESYTLARNAVEKLKKLDPSNPQSLYRFINDAFRREEYTEVEELINQFENIVGENETVMIYKMRLAASQDKNDLHHRLIDKAYKKYPENEYFVELKYEKESQLSKNKAAGKVLSKYLAKNYSTELLGEQAGHFFKTGEFSKGFKNIEGLAGNEPDKISNHLSLGILYQLTHQFDKAIGYYKTCQRFAPSYSVYYEAEAECQEELGKSALALIAYRKALKYDRSNIELQNKVRELELKKPVLSYFDPVDFKALVKTEIDSEKYKDQPYVIVHQEEQIVLFDGGGSMFRNYRVIKVLNVDGVDFLKDYSISSSYLDNLTIETSDIIKPNGTVVTAERYYNRLFFASLEPGDMITISYKAERSSGGRFTDVINDFYYLNSFVPVLSNKISLLVPTEKSLLIRNQNIDIEYELRQPTVDFDMYVWQTGELPEIKDEISLPDYLDFGSYVAIGSDKDWDFYADWYKDVVYNKIKPDYFVWKKSAELFQGKEHLTDYEKVQIIYEYVTSQISYSHTTLRNSGYVPQKASDVIVTKMGDCKDVTGLFIALCATVGIDANYVLVSTRENGLYGAPIPRMVFDHTIAKVDIDGEDHYIELTSSHLPFGALFHSTVGAFSLDIDPAKATDNEPFYLNPENRVKNYVHRIQQIEISGDSMIVATENIKTGVSKHGMKSSYLQKSEAEQFNILEEIIASGNVNAGLKEFYFVNGLDDLTPEVSYNYIFTDIADITSAGSMEVLSIEFTDEIGRYDRLITKERKNPLELYDNLSAVDEFNQIIELEIPAGKSILELPENITVGDKHIEMNLEFELNENKLIISRNVKILQGRVETENYEAFKDVLSKIIKSDNQKIVIVSKT